MMRQFAAISMWLALLVLALPQCHGWKLDSQVFAEPVQKIIFASCNEYVCCNVWCVSLLTIEFRFVVRTRYHHGNILTGFINNNST
jgi:hypothetical protein